MKFNEYYIFLIILFIVGFFIIYYFFTKEPITNVGVVNDENNVDVNDVIDNLNQEELNEHSMTPEEENIEQETLDKFNWKNKADNNYAKSNYATGVRGKYGNHAWDKVYQNNSNAITGSFVDNNGFAPLDETKGSYATYEGKGNAKLTPDELFKVDKLLPQEVKPDWFDVMPEPIKVKNRHLINVVRPVGINTIGTSLKNPSYDLRGSPPCPKHVVSPWLQSSYEPDLNIKGLQ